MERYLKMENEGWFTSKMMKRVNTENNCLLIVEGETGTGKSCLALSLAQNFDSYFSPRRIAFTGKEFLDLLPLVPHKGWIVWDEVGVSLSHRQWQSDLNVVVMKVLQSFRFKLINVIFTVPSAKYIDVVAREMCHYLLRMQQRGQASVYRITKSPFEGRIYTPFCGTCYSEMPTQGLWKEFKEMHTEHQEILYEKSRKAIEAKTIKDSETLERALSPKETMETLKEKAMLILPQIVDSSRDSDQGLVDVTEMRRLLKIPHTVAYRLRKGVIKELHKDDHKLLRGLSKEKTEGKA